MIRLALIRHGHTAWNRAGRIQGRTDIPLDDEAREGLAKLRLPADWSEAALCSSPLARARETATLISDREPLAEPALMEMNWGDWEGAQAAALHADPECDHRPIEEWGWHYTPPNGESPDALRARLLPWIAALEQDTIAVCHIGVMRVILALATDWHFDGPAPFRIKRNRLYVMDVEGEALRLHPDPVRLVERAP